jgi:hypothetical protein
MSRVKFSHLINDEHVVHDYGNVYFQQPCGDGYRLVIGPSTTQVNLLTELAGELEGNPWFVLYVLLVPRQGNREPGRYESVPFESLESLSQFLQDFGVFFESDGRHHVWIGSADGLLVYDQHNVIFAYGPLDKFEAILRSHSFRESEFWFPSPHGHSYLPENDAEEERLMNAMNWSYSPLQTGDEWD